MNDIFLLAIPFGLLGLIIGIFLWPFDFLKKRPPYAASGKQLPSFEQAPTNCRVIQIPMARRSKRDLRDIMYDENASLQDRQAAIMESMKNPNMTRLGLTQWGLLSVQEEIDARTRDLIAYVRKGDPDDLVVQKCTWELMGNNSVHWLQQQVGEAPILALHGTLEALHAGSMDWDEWLKMKLPV